MHLFYPLQRIVRRWLDEGYLQCSGETHPAMAAYQDIAERAAELIYAACQRAMGRYTRARASFRSALARNEENDGELPSSLAAESKKFLGEIEGLLDIVCAFCIEM